MNTPQRTLRCAACGAHPQWVALDSNDPTPTPLCSRCAVVNDRGSRPPPTAPTHALPSVKSLAEHRRGSTIPTPLALVAVFVASFLPHAAVALSDSSGRVRRAFDAAWLALTEDVREPVLGAARSRPRAPTPQPMIAPQAAVIPIATMAPTQPQSVPSILVTRDIARTLPASVGIREGDRITRIDDRTMTDSGFGQRVCTAMKRRFTLEWWRDEQVIRRTLQCATLDHRVELERRSRLRVARMLATNGGVARRGLAQRR
ncbi:MAG: hypothetical protein U0269_30190 [Polyangiales bacterium]